MGDAFKIKECCISLYESVFRLQKETCKEENVSLLPDQESLNYVIRSTLRSFEVSERYDYNNAIISIPHLNIKARLLYWSDLYQLLDKIEKSSEELKEEQMDIGPIGRIFGILKGESI